MKGKVVVVGGGIAGIFSALLYNHKGFNVTLVEKGNEIGGLLRSQKLFDDQLSFDFGTHFLRETGNEEIDTLLFENLEAIKYDFLKSGTFYKELYEENGFLSDKNISDRKNALDQLKQKEPKETYSDLEEQLKSEFGEGYGKILSEIVTKFFFTEPEKLIENAHTLFGLSRIVVGNQGETKELKTQTKFDNVIAYHSYKEGISSLKNIYPIKNGAGAWIDAMERTLVENDVRVIKNAELGDFEQNDNCVTSVQVNDETLELDKLVWTIPSFILLNKLGVKLKLSPPERLTSCIFHYVIDQDYLTDLYYFQCFDPSLKTFRVTLYDNYSDGVDGKYRISVEVLTNESDIQVEKMSTEIFKELITMKVIDSSANKLDVAHNIYKNGFPVLNHDFMKSSLMQYNAVMEKCENIEIYGKGKGKTWFMNDIIFDIYNSIN